MKTNIWKNLLLMIAVLTGISTSAQNIMRFEVLAGNVDHTDCLLSLSVDQLNYSTDSLKLALFEIKGKTEAAVPFKMETAGGAKAWFILSGQTLKNTKRTFVFRKTIKSQIFKSGIIAGKKDGALNLKSGEKPIMSYQIETVNPPSGISPFYKRSAFLHPFYSPGGEVLTRIQAPDHYHHFGNWNTWTLTFLGKREVDFWNLSKGEGTVRFAGLISQVEDPVYTGFKSLQEHIDFGTKEGRSGLLFMSFPENRMHPEPMRVWPEDQNGGGEVYFEFCPFRHEGWKIEKGNNYTLRHRLVIFDGKMTPEEAENYWQAFANPPQIVLGSNAIIN